MVRIITDSAADFEPEELKNMDITCIPLPVMFDGVEYYENVDLSKERFYQLLAESSEFPKTSQASPQILLELFEQAQNSGDEAIYITLSSGLSGTYQSACMTQSSFDHEGLYVVDSLNATGGQRLIVEHAVKLRDAGKTAGQIAAELEKLRERVMLYACMDTMEYLYRGGRISHTTYKLGSLAQIKPIISIDHEGRVAVPAKAMGMRKGMDFMCKRLDSQKPDKTYPLYVMYTHDRSNGEALAQRVRAMGFAVPEDRIINVGAAIGSHIGPNACGLVYISDAGAE